MYQAEARHPEVLLTTRETGLLLRHHPRTIRRWVAQGRIAAERAPGGRKLLIPSGQFLSRGGAVGLVLGAYGPRIVERVQQEHLEASASYHKHSEG